MSTKNATRESSVSCLQSDRLDVISQLPERDLCSVPHYAIKCEHQAVYNSFLASSERRVPCGIEKPRNRVDPLYQRPEQVDDKNLLHKIIRNSNIEELLSDRISKKAVSRLQRVLHT